MSERKALIAFFLKSSQMATVWEDEKATVQNHHTKIYFIQSMPVHMCVSCGSNYGSHATATELDKFVCEETDNTGTAISSC